MCRHTANCIDSRVAADVLGSAAIGADAAHQLIRFSVSAWRFLLRPLDSLGPRLALVCADATLAPSPNLLLATVTEPPMACDENARHTPPPLWTPVGGMMACADGVARQPQFQTPRPRAPGRAGSAGR